LFFIEAESEISRRGEERARRRDSERRRSKIIGCRRHRKGNGGNFGREGPKKRNYIVGGESEQRKIRKSTVCTEVWGWGAGERKEGKRRLIRRKRGGYLGEINKSRERHSITGPLIRDYLRC